MKLEKNMMAVVTGGGSGMGEACARLLAAKGLKVAIFDYNEQAAVKVASDINGIAINCDVANGAAVEQAFQQLQEETESLRVVINCAGIAPAKRTVGREGPMALTEFETVISVNLVGTFNIIRLAAAMMQKNQLIDEERGVIINTASIAAFEGQIGQAAYSASKGGIIAMTLPLAREFASMAIRVNSIAPGLVATPLLLNMPEAVQQALSDSIPFPKRFAKVEEYAALVQHIINNSMLNGETIRLDGALRMQAK